jgi:hypothetical protein
MQKEIAAPLQPLYVRIPAKIVSYIFHPLFIPTYIFFWLTMQFPFHFAGITPFNMFTRKINVFWTTAFFPAFSVFLLWRLKFADSILLKTQKERIIPYIITMIFYWWMWYLSRSFTDQPSVLKFFYFGIFLSTVAGLIFNNFFKISMHAMGIGAAFICVLITCLTYHIYLGFDICVMTLITGAVCSSRLLLNDHFSGDVYMGLFVGMLCQLIAYPLVMY